MFFYSSNEKDIYGVRLRDKEDYNLNIVNLRDGKETIETVDTVVDGDLAVKLGMDRKNVVTLETGQVLELSKDEVNTSKRVQTGEIYVDGIGVGDVGNIVLRDRRDLARDGMVTIVVAINSENYSIVAGPDIITRGFVYAREAEDLINKIKEVSKDEIESCLNKNILEWQVIKSNVKKSVENLLYNKTKRRPSVFTIIMEV